MQFLLGIPNKIKTLIDRLTSSRASNLDNLDATVSSRAPANTALSNNTWTDAKAGNINTAISSRAPASTALSTSQWTNTRAGYIDNLSGGIASSVLGSTRIQTGYFGFAIPTEGQDSGFSSQAWVDVPLPNAVSNVNHCLCFAQGFGYATSPSHGSVTTPMNYFEPRLINTSTLRVVQRRTTDPPRDFHFRWYVVEFKG